MNYTKAEDVQDLWQIIEIQAQNLPDCLDEPEMKAEGFVTVKHDPQLLEEMNQPYPHIIAKTDERVVGFALVMLKEFGDRIPVLVPMFDLINQLEWRGEPLREANYFVMGQICIRKGYRGQGVSKGLYEKLRKEMSPHFDMVITEIATRNTRSIKAHEKVGFKHLERYTADGEEWDIVIWDWHK